MLKKEIFLSLFPALIFLVGCGGSIDPAENVTYGGQSCIELQGSRSFDSVFSEIPGDFDAYFAALIPNYGSLYFEGPSYVMLYSDDLNQWETPDMLTDVSFRLCQTKHLNTYQEMAEIRDYLNEHFWDYYPHMNNVTGWGIDIFENMLVIYLYELNAETILNFKTNVVNSPLIEFRAGAWSYWEYDGEE